jgi:hypothetical protein
MKAGAFIVILGILVISGCGQGTQQAVVESAVPTAVFVDQSAIWNKWQQSPHSHTYDPGKGPNTYCARCHAPRNWDPQAVIDPPPNCVSCKFEFEDEPRVAAGNPPVPPGEWLDIRCDICHEMNEGLADPQPVWWDQAAAQYVPVTYSSASCEECHRDTEVLRHGRELGSDAHADFQCTDCHDAHSVAASCADSRCHSEWSVEHHDEERHTAVSCIACHDASSLDVGPREAGGQWITWRTTELMGRSSTEPYQSHAVALAVDCARCHFAGNEWGLETLSPGDAPSP